MLNKFSNWVTSKGKWNHAIVVAIFMWPVALILWLPSFIPFAFFDLWPTFSMCAFFSAFAFFAGYFGREVTTVQRHLRGLDAFNINLWPDHDRLQTIYLTVVGFGLAILSMVIEALLI